MATQVSKTMNESSDRENTINEEPDLCVYNEAREMWIIDQAIREAEARKEGWEEGRNKARREIITRLNESGVPIEVIIEITDLSPEEVRVIIGR